LPFLLGGVLAIVGVVLALPLLHEAKHSQQTQALPTGAMETETEADALVVHE
jgi:hypothetical protein